MAIEQELVGIGNVAKSVQINEHSFLKDMVGVDNHDGNLNSIILITQMAEKSESILPEVHISADELKHNSQYEKEQNPKVIVTRGVSVNNEELEAVDPKHWVSANKLEIIKHCERQNSEIVLKEDFNHTIMSAIDEQRGINFKNPVKPIEIGGHPFLINTVDASGQKEVLRSKVLTSTKAKELGVLDPDVQISDRELKDEDRYEHGKSSERPRKKVTFQILPDKFQLKEKDASKKE